jgi:hypothetical protein
MRAEKLASPCACLARTPILRIRVSSPRSRPKINTSIATFEGLTAAAQDRLGHCKLY